ncbi:MAG: tripartite tricarboxylate transporter substrate binding protein [Burkholderiales bacterium]
MYASLRPQRSDAVSRTLRVVLLLALTACAGCNDTPGYPSKPVTLIVAFPAGGPTDINARIFADALSRSLDTPVAVVNRAGAGGNIGAGLAASAPPDGHTLLYNTSAIVIAPTFHAEPGFDPIADFVPVALTATVPLVLVVNAALPVRSARELIDHAKARPGVLNYGSAGYGTITHLAPALFMARAGIDAQHVPYRGSAPALAGLAGGQVQLGIDTLNTVLPYVEDRRLRALAVASAVRDARLPGVPTLYEALGESGFEMSAWQGIVAPAGTPKAIVSRLNTEINSIANDPLVRERLTVTGSEPLGGSSEDYAAFLRAEVIRWVEVANTAGTAVE